MRAEPDVDGTFRMDDPTFVRSRRRNAVDNPGRRDIRRTRQKAGELQSAASELALEHTSAGAQVDMSLAAARREHAINEQEVMPVESLQPLVRPPQ